MQIWLVPVVLLARTARAEPVELEWDAEGACPSREQVLAELAALVTRQPAHDVRARVQLRPVSGGYVGELNVGSGQRTLTGRTCREVADAAVVIVALAIDATAHQPERSETAKAPEGDAPKGDAPKGDAPESGAAKLGAQSQPMAVSPRVATEKSAAARDPHRPEREEAPTKDTQRTMSVLSVALRGVVDVGGLPKAAAGASLAGRVGNRWLVGELSATGFLPRSGQLASDSRFGADVWLAFGGAAVCGAPLRTGGVLGCLGFELGVLSARGQGVDQPTSGASLWSALSAQARGRYALSRRVGVEATAGVAWPFTRPEFGLAGLGVVHRPALLCGRFSLGLDFR